MASLSYENLLQVTLCFRIRRTSDDSIALFGILVKLCVQSVLFYLLPNFSYSFTLPASNFFVSLDQSNKHPLYS